MLFQILRGQHAQGSYPKDHPKANTPVVYERGDIVESTKDLRMLNGQMGVLGPKFALVTDPTVKPTDRIGDPISTDSATSSQAEDDQVLDSFTIAELRDYAESEAIDLGTAKTKDQIIKVIREIRKAALVG